MVKGRGGRGGRRRRREEDVELFLLIDSEEASLAVQVD
jgi:hypothetical protein